MRNSIFATLGFLLVLTSAKGQGFRSPVLEALRDHRDAQITFENLDYSVLREQARRHKPAVPSEDLEKLVRSNFRFIFFNKLNKRNFLLTPEPDIVAGKIVNIFKLNKEIGGLVDKGRELGPHPDSSDEKEVVVGQIAELAEELQDIFSQYFIEIRSSSYSFDLRPFSTKSGQFIQYIQLTGQMSQLLNNEIENYFLNSAPGIMEVSQYGGVTIGVLTKSLQKLSDITAKRLSQ